MDLLDFISILPPFTHVPGGRWDISDVATTSTANDGTTFTFEKQPIFSSKTTCSFHVKTQHQNESIPCSFTTKSCRRLYPSDEDSSQLTPDSERPYCLNFQEEPYFEMVRSIFRFEMYVLHTQQSSQSFQNGTQTEHEIAGDLTDGIWVKIEEEVFLLDHNLSLQIEVIQQTTTQPAVVKFYWADLDLVLNIHGLNFEKLTNGVELLGSIFKNKPNTFEQHKKISFGLKYGFGNITPSGTGQRSSMSSSQSSTSSGSIESRLDDNNFSSSNYAFALRASLQQLNHMNRCWEILASPMNGNQCHNLNSKRKDIQTLGKEMNHYHERRKERKDLLKNVASLLEKDICDTSALRSAILMKMFPTIISNKPSISQMEQLTTELQHVEKKRDELYSSKMHIDLAISEWTMNNITDGT